MSVRVYQYGLLAPVEGETLVRGQLRAAHEYRNELVAIERGRRSALRAVDATDAVHEAEAIVRTATRSTRKAAVSALRAARKAARDEARAERARISDLDASIRRDARALTACYWGSYLDIEARHQQSRAQPLYGADAVTPNDPDFVRGPRWRDALSADDPRSHWWLSAGQIGVQIQGGITTSDALSCSDTRVQLELRGEGSRGRRYGVLSVRVGSDGRAPVWARWPIKLHRAMPDAATWKWVRVSVRPEGMRERWTVEITVDDPNPRARDLIRPRGGAVAVEWEWTPVDDGGIRVARWVDTAGGRGDIVLPAAIANGIRRPAGLRAVRDLLRNDFAPALARAIRASPASATWMREAANTMHLWQSTARFVALAMRWRAAGLPEPREAYAMLDAFEARERHLYDYECSSRREALRERREYYRVLASRWARTYETVLLSDQDLSREARWGDDSDVRFVAGVSEARTALRQAFGEPDAVDAVWRDGADEDDERSWCERCRDAWIAGGARGDGRFAGRKEKTVNAWAKRRAKKGVAGGDTGPARETAG